MLGLQNSTVIEGRSVVGERVTEVVVVDIIVVVVGLGVFVVGLSVVVVGLFVVVI